MKAAIFAVSLLALSSPAFAASTSPHWILYNGKNNTCQSAKQAARASGYQQLASPLAWRNFAREQPKYGGYTITNLGHGQRMVDIASRGTAMVYFTDMNTCKEYIYMLERAGQNLNELR